jgi:hypothetical protein
MLLHLTRHTSTTTTATPPVIVTVAKVQCSIYLYLFMIHLEIQCSLDSLNSDFLWFCFVQVALKSRSFLQWVPNSEMHISVCIHDFKALLYLILVIFFVHSCMLLCVLSITSSHWHSSPEWARACSLLRLHDHTQTHHTW